ncbi:MAG: hypothetical protein HY758_03745 [Nitrospirae bacterium]|nr:hypothetical protein [Nitrospirota bacterium]
MMKMNIKTLCAILIILVFISGCSGKDKVKPSADSLLTTEALNDISIVRTAYQDKNNSALQNYLAPELYESISKQMFFDRNDLSLSPQIVRIIGTEVMVTVNWQGVWTMKSEARKDRGVAIFVFEGSPMKLVRIDGDHPFLIPLSRD